MALLDEVLDQNKQEAAQLAVKTVAGPDVLTTPDVLARLEQYQADTQAIINAQAQQITDLLSQMATLLQQLATKASADSLASVRQRVTTAEATLATTATTAYVSQQLQAIADIDAGQAQALAGLQAALATDEGVLQGILGKQATYDLLLPALRTDVDAKATTATVSNLTGQVTTLRNTVNDTTTGLATRASSADVAAATASLATLTTTVAGKALTSDVTALSSVVGTKASAADLQSLTTTVAGKALASDLTATNNTVAALTTTVSGKALASDLAATNSNVTTNTNAIALRATTASVTALQASVTQNTTDIAARATTAALAIQAGRIDGLLNTTVPALQADTATRLLRAGDTATGSIMVPNATQAAAAPRLDQTYGGLNAPIRFATNVGATATAMLPGPLTDPTPQGRKAKPYLVVLTMRTAPTAGATITVGTTAGGAEVFTKTYTLAALPGLNTVLAPMQPIFIELPAGTTLYAKATAGAWDVEVLSYYKS